MYKILVVGFFCAVLAYFIYSAYIGKIDKFGNNVDDKKFDIYLITLHSTDSIKVKSSIENITKFFGPDNNITIVKGVELTPEEHRHMKNKYKSGLGKGVMGCCKAHANVWEIISKKNSSNWSFIFEDDVVLLNDLNIRDIINYFPKGSHSINLGGCARFMNRTLQNLTSRDISGKIGNFNIYTFNGWPLCLHSYSMTSEGANKALKNHNLNKYKRPVDLSLNLSDEFSNGAFLLHYDKTAYGSYHHTSSGIFGQIRDDGIDGIFYSDIKRVNQTYNK